MTSHYPAISVLMPVYNAERYVAEAVESILNQTFRDFEFLIINDGSTDGSLAILERYAAKDPRIRLISRENKGITPTLNEGIDLARAPYIARMDADDISLPERFEKQYAYMEAHPECVACGTGAIIIDEDGLPITSYDRKVQHQEILNALLNNESGVILHPTCFLKRDALLKLNGYRQEIIHAEDYDLFLRLSEIGDLHNIPDAFCFYRMHSSSVGHAFTSIQSKSHKKALLEALTRRGLDEQLEYWRKKFFESSIQDSKENKIHNKKWAWWALKGGNVKTARKHAWRAFKQQPWNKESWRVLYCALRGY